MALVGNRYTKATAEEWEELDFTDHAVGDELEVLTDRLWEDSGRTSIRRLVLQRCSLGPQAFDTVGKFLKGGLGDASPLEALVLSGNDVGPGGLQREFIEGVTLNKRLKSLDISCCSLLDEGIVLLCAALALRCPAVSEPAKLEELHLGCNRLTQNGAKTLGTCLATNLHLLRLDLQANTIGQDGAFIIAQGLADNKGRLKELNVSQNELTFKGARALAKSFMVQEVRFVIEIMRPLGKRVGLTLTADMLVSNVTLDSAIHRWNLEKPCDAIFLGDHIVKVNTFEDPEEMTEELESGEALEITLVRRGGLANLDLCHNMITLKGVHELRRMLGCPGEGSLRGWQLSWEGGTRQLWLTAH